MMLKIPYVFSAPLWKYGGKGAWYFVTLPESLSEEIRLENKHLEAGWGRLQCEARIGNSVWATAIWFDTKTKAYLLPVKSDIRNKEKLEAGLKIEVQIFI